MTKVVERWRLVFLLSTATAFLWAAATVLSIFDDDQEEEDEDGRT
jgi:hypothetical protein